jgi:hypothetical protein
MENRKRLTFSLIGPKVLCDHIGERPQDQATVLGIFHRYASLG